VYFVITVDFLCQCKTVLSSGIRNLDTRGCSLRSWRWTPRWFVHCSVQGTASGIWKFCVLTNAASTVKHYIFRCILISQITYVKNICCIFSWHIFQALMFYAGKVIVMGKFEKFTCI